MNDIVGDTSGRDKTAGPPGRARRRFPLDRLFGVSEEVGFFIRAAAFGLGATLLYWFMTYEIAGTILLGAVGVGAAAMAAVMGVMGPRQSGRFLDIAPRDPAEAQPVDGPFGDDTGLAPTPTLAPLEIAFGAMLLTMSLPFGPWMAIAAIVPLAAGCIAWLTAAEEDSRLPRAAELLAQRAIDAEVAARRAQAEARPLEPMAHRERPWWRQAAEFLQAAIVTAVVGAVLAALPRRGGLPLPGGRRRR